MTSRNLVASSKVTYPIYTSIWASSNQTAKTLRLSDSCLTRTKFDYYGRLRSEYIKEKADVDVMLVNKREDDKLQRSLPQLSITAPSPRSSKYQCPVDSLLDNHPSPIATNAKINQWYQSMVNHRRQQVNGIKYASCLSFWECKSTVPNNEGSW